MTHNDLLNAVLYFLSKYKEFAQLLLENVTSDYSLIIVRQIDNAIIVICQILIIGNKKDRSKLPLATVVTSFWLDAQLKLYPYINDVLQFGLAGRW